MNIRLFFFKRHAVAAFENLDQEPGLEPIMPQGAMYMMVKIQLEKFPKFSSCQVFTEALTEEQSVLLFPSGPCFNFEGFMRIVLTVPENLIVEACARIALFCKKHIQP